MLKITGSFIIAAALITPGVSQAMDGGRLFASKCAACHGPKGEGSPVGPALKGNSYVMKGTPDEIKKLIIMGRSGEEKKYPEIMIGMPSGLATEAEADALVVYLQGGLQK